MLVIMALVTTLATTPLLLIVNRELSEGVIRAQRTSAEASRPVL
jgi:hypothetical protein